MNCIQVHAYSVERIASALRNRVTTRLRKKRCEVCMCVCYRADDDKNLLRETIFEPSPSNLKVHYGDDVPMYFISFFIQI